MQVLIQYSFQIRFPLSRTKTAIENINYLERLEFNNLKDLLEELSEKFTISNDPLIFTICPNNYDLIVSGKYNGLNNSQETFFELISPFVRDFEIFVIINTSEGETIIVKWIVHDGSFEVQNHYLENAYDEGIDDSSEIDDNELFTLLEDYGLDFDHVLEVMQNQEEVEESKDRESEMEISEDSEDDFEFPDIFKAVEYFINKNHFPSYETMKNRINDNKYSEHIHILCKRIYEDISNTEFVKSQCFSVKNQYGIEGFEMVKKVLVYHSPLKNSLKSRIRNYPKNVLNL